ncbi:hypothetical protein GCM10023259_032920 [Thermocatellispora tengchongensis]
MGPLVTLQQEKDLTGPDGVAGGIVPGPADGIVPGPASGIVPGPVSRRARRGAHGWCSGGH